VVRSVRFLHGKRERERRGTGVKTRRKWKGDQNTEDTTGEITYRDGITPNLTPYSNCVLNVPGAPDTSGLTSFASSEREQVEERKNH